MLSQDAYVPSQCFICDRLSLGLYIGAKGDFFDSLVLIFYLLASLHHFTGEWWHSSFAWGFQEICVDNSLYVTIGQRGISTSSQGAQVLCIRVSCQFLRMNQPHLSSVQSSDEITTNAWALSSALAGCSSSNKDNSTVSVQCHELVTLLSENWNSENV